jgi:phospholipase C
VPQSLALVHQHLPRNVLRYCGMITFYEDAAGPETEFPAYCFIEPDYFWPGANDDHPPTDIMAGQQLIADVYNALRAN